MQKHLKPVFSIPLILTLLALLGSAGCNAWKDQPVSSPILLVGVDGVSWDLARPLIAEGRMPTFKRLMTEGRHGFLKTLVPTQSPVIWTTVATGVSKDIHRIQGFAADTPRGLKLYDNSFRKAAAIWNILTEYEKRVCVVGWWMTYPTEPINGVMVAQTNTLDQFNTKGGKVTWKGTLRAGVPRQVHPPEMESQVMEVLGEVEEELPGLTDEIFGTFPHPFSRLGDRLWSNCRWSFRADQTYSRITRQLLGDDQPFDLAMVYFGGSDVAGHRFYRYLHPELFDNPPDEEQIANFGEVITHYYSWIDSEVGRLIELCSDEVTVVIISDHGMIPVNRDNRFDPEDPPANVNSAHHYDGPPGIFLAAGPWIEPAPNWDESTISGSVYDIAPTILAMMRLPLGRDMEGRVLEELFSERFQVGLQPRAIKSHSTEAFLISRRSLAKRHLDESDRIEQLQSLGYIPEE